MHILIVMLNTKTHILFVHMHTNMPLGVIKHTLENTLENNYGDKGNGNVVIFGRYFLVVMHNTQHTPYTPGLPLELVLENLLENDS